MAGTTDQIPFLSSLSPKFMVIKMLTRQNYLNSIVFYKPKCPFNCNVCKVERNDDYSFQKQKVKKKRKLVLLYSFMHLRTVPSSDNSKQLCVVVDSLDI